MYLIAMYKKPGVVQGVEFYFPNPDRNQEMKDPSFIGYFELFEAGDSNKFIQEDRLEDIKPSSINDAICNLKKRIQDAITEGKDPSDEMLEEYLNLIREKKAKRAKFVAVVADYLQFAEWARDTMRGHSKLFFFKTSADPLRHTVSVTGPNGYERIYKLVTSKRDAIGIQWSNIIVIDDSRTDAIAEVNQSIKRYSANPEPSPVVKQAAQVYLSTDWERGERFITYKFPVCAKNITPPTYTLKK